MSTIRTLALGALMVVGVAGVSAAQSTAPRVRADSGHYARRGPGGREGFGRDLNLTDAQKTQIKAIRAKYKSQNEAVRAQAKPYMDAAKAARQKGDTVGFRTNIAKARQIETGASFRTQEQADIRAILTPAQQAKWDAQQKAAATRRAEGGKKGWGRKHAGAAPAAKS